MTIALLYPEFDLSGVNLSDMQKLLLESTPSVSLFGGVPSNGLSYYLAGRCGGKSQINTDHLWGLLLDNWKYSKLMKSKSKQSRYVRVYL